METPIIPEVQSIEPLLYGLAWRFHTAKGTDLEDLISEGLYAYVLASKQYDAARGTAFSTYLWHKARGRMRDLAYGKRVDTQQLTEEPPTKENRFDQVLRDLSEDGQEICRILFMESIPRNRRGALNKRKIKEYVQNYCEQIHQWNTMRIQQAFQEVSLLVYG